MADSEYIVPKGSSWNTTGKVAPSKEAIDRVFSQADKIKTKKVKKVED